jgi:O-antigen ligase
VPGFALGVVAVSILSPAIGHKILHLVTLKMDHSSSVRLDLWQGYWAMFKESPILGVGLFNGDRLLPAYFTQLSVQQTFVSHAHNNFLQWLAGAGLPGLVLFVSLSGWFLFTCWRHRSLTSIFWGLFLAQLFLHIGGLTEAGFFDGEVNHLLIFLWSLTLALNSLGKPERSHHQGKMAGI